MAALTAPDEPDTRAPLPTSISRQSPIHQEACASPLAENVKEEKNWEEDGSLPLDSDGYLPFYFLDAVEEAARPGEPGPQGLPVSVKCDTLRPALVLRLQQQASVGRKCGNDGCSEFLYSWGEACCWTVAVMSFSQLRDDVSRE